MKIELTVSENNKKVITDIIEETGYRLPCNCHGKHMCAGEVYDFDCSMIPECNLSVEVGSIRKYDEISALNIFDNEINLLTKNVVTTEDELVVYENILIDLGTTTVACVFCNAKTGQVQKKESFSNPQVTLGTDIISRIRYEIESGDKELSELILNKIAKVVERRYKYNNKLRPACIFVAGNTVMSRIFLKRDISPMAYSPYIPDDYCGFDGDINIRDGRFVFGEDANIKDCDLAYRGFAFERAIHLKVLPSLASFIGGDILAGMIYLGMNKRNDTVVLADLGTNGEIALLSEGKILIASTAAGPCFEGGGLKCGCPAVNGAISDIRINFDENKLRPDEYDNVRQNEYKDRKNESCKDNMCENSNGNMCENSNGYMCEDSKDRMCNNSNDIKIKNRCVVRYETIANKIPVGICGSGAFSFLAEVIRSGIMNSEGIIGDAFPQDGFEIATKVSGEKIYITKEDIRNVQTAIAAISAGFDTLLEKAGKNPSDVDRLYIAGGMGYHIKTEDVLQTGLFEGVKSDRMEFTGNTSMMGLFDLAKNRCDIDKVYGEIMKKMIHVELSESKYFKERFIDKMKNYRKCNNKNNNS